MRLIDADALKEKAVHYSETEYHFDHDAVQMDDIDDAPTINASRGTGWRNRRMKMAGICLVFYQDGKMVAGGFLIPLTTG